MWTQLEVFGADLIDKVGFIKVLMNLAEFLGWSGKPGDGNLDFIQKYDSKIKKIAVVGAWEWKENSMIFLAAGYRKAEVRYFVTEQKNTAIEWLKS